MNTNENIIEQLRNSVQTVVQKTGTDSKLAKDLLKKIQSLQDKLTTLTAGEKLSFLIEMQDSFRGTIEKVERKLVQHAQFEKVYNYSIVVAISCIVLFVFGLFGFKLYKSLMEKEAKKQGKVKGKQSKKSKKTN